MMAHVQNSEQLLRKGLYPYDYVDEPFKFNETKRPSQEDFNSKLQEEGSSNEDYAHAQMVWDEFQCNNFGEYHELYLKTDVRCF